MENNREFEKRHHRITEGDTHISKVSPFKITEIRSNFIFLRMVSLFAKSRSPGVPYEISRNDRIF